MSLKHHLSTYALASALSAVSLSCADTTPAPNQNKTPNGTESTDKATKSACPDAEPCPEVNNIKIICEQANKDTNISLYEVKSNSDIKDLCRNRTYKTCVDDDSECTHCKTDLCYLYQNNSNLVTILPPYEESGNNTHLGQAIVLQNGRPVICDEEFRKTATATTTTHQPANSSTVKSFTPPVTGTRGGINDDTVLNHQIEQIAKDNAMNAGNETPDAGTKD